MGDVGRVTGHDAGLEAATDPVDDELAHGSAGPRLIRSRLEVCQRPGEHDLREYGVGADEHAEGLDNGDQVRPRIAGFPEAFQVGPEKLEAVEEHLTDQP